MKKNTEITLNVLIIALTLVLALAFVVKGAWLPAAGFGLIAMLNVLALALRLR